jgi:hypothetical protein
MGRGARGDHRRRSGGAEGWWRCLVVKELCGAMAGARERVFLSLADLWCECGRVFGQRGGSENHDKVEMDESRSSGWPNWGRARGRLCLTGIVRGVVIMSRFGVAEDGQNYYGQNNERGNRTTCNVERASRQGAKGAKASSAAENVRAQLCALAPWREAFLARTGVTEPPAASLRSTAG